MTVGEKIREARKKLGLTQNALARRLGIPYQGISQYERGTRNPKLETLNRIADSLGVPLSQLLPDDVQPAKGPIQKEFNRAIMKRFMEVK